VNKANVYHLLLPLFGLVRCNHNPMSQKGCQIKDKTTQSYRNIYVLPEPWQLWQVVAYSFI
jgi:hypothetical protein